MAFARKKNLVPANLARISFLQKKIIKVDEDSHLLAHPQEKLRDFHHIYKFVEALVFV
jgi:hypothetical protein